MTGALRARRKPPFRHRFEIRSELHFAHAPGLRRMGIAAGCFSASARESLGA
jgi:hypothetical protein